MTVIKIVPMPGPQGPAGSGGTEIVPLPSFLEWSAGRDHLPALNTNFGWDSNGLWFGDAITEGPWGTPSYPVYTDVVFEEFDKTVVTFDVAIEDYCSDIGVCFYPSGETPYWAWESHGTRIAAQFDCPNPVIHGMSSSNTGQDNTDDIPDVGMYRVVFTYDPNAETDKVVFDTYLIDGSTLTLQSHITLNEQFELNGGTYKVGFASDNSANDEAAQNPPYITYISNLTIDVNDGETVYEDSLKNGYSGEAVNLVAPLNIKDANGENLLRIEKGYTGVTRIDALQDDLALRSSRDIILYPGDDGEGKVYIGWGDANYTPTATNEVATLADVDEAIVNAGPVDTTFTVAGGALETSPTFSSDPLFTGSYVKHGDSVLFRINVEMTNITNFGTGQYYVDLPFPSKYGIIMRDGCLHDESNGNQWAISGHVAAGQSRLALWYTNTTGQDEIFDHNSPVTLNVLDTFHVSGSYIASAVG